MALSGSWLAEFDPPPATSAVRRILEEVALLDSTLTKRDELQDRMVRMESDQAAYAEEIKGLVEELGGEFEPERPVVQGDALKARLAAAVANQTSCEGLNKKISALSEEITSVEGGLAELHALASPMFEAFGVDSLRAVDEKLQQVSRRKTLREDLSEREAGLVEAMKAESLDAAEATLTDASGDDLENKIAETGARLADVSKRTQELYHQLETAKEAINAIGGDEAVARLEGDFEASFDLALFQMGRSVFAPGYHDHTLDIAVKETPDRPNIRMNDEDFADWSPGEAMLADCSHLSFDWLEIADDGESFAALRALPRADKQALFAACVARTVKGQLAFEPQARPELEATVARLDIDFAKLVRPTAATYWSRITVTVSSGANSRLRLSTSSCGSSGGERGLA